MMWVCLWIPRYMYMYNHCTVKAHVHITMYTSIQACFLCFFYNPSMSLFYLLYCFAYICNVQVSQTGIVFTDQHMYGNRSDSSVRVGGETTGAYSGHTATTTHH